MAIVWVIDIPKPKRNHLSDLKALRDIGLKPSQLDSWKLNNRSLEGFVDLIERAGLIDLARNERIYARFSDLSSIDTMREHTDIEQYFAENMARTIDKMGLSDYNPPDIPDLIAFNLMPFYLRAADANRLARGISEVLATVDKIGNLPFVFIIRDLSSFSNLKIFKDLVEINKGPDLVSAIDFFGHQVLYQKKYQGDVKTCVITRHKIDAAGAREKILVHDDDSLRKALIYNTNINIGHFDVGSCHVRTHYDLEDFIQFDNVFESIYKQFCNFIDGYKNISILATGLESEALITLGNRFVYRNNDEIKYRPPENKKINWISHLSKQELLKQKDTIISSFENSDLLIILSDILNTGKTVDEFSEIIESYEKERTTKHKLDIKPFSILKMLNSPKEVYSCVHIPRPYFEKSDCPLCFLDQPKVIISEDNWKEDFRSVNQDQLTPLDYWEMVEDCKALVREKPDSNGKIIFHRVDTLKMMGRYRLWIKMYIRLKYKEEWGDTSISALITTDEPYGIEFCNLVKDALNFNKYRTIKIPREVIADIDPLPMDLSKSLEEVHSEDILSLIIDDGINSGGTIKKIYSLLTDFDITPIGAFVIDSRIDSKTLKCGETDLLFHSLYNWPFAPVSC